jgi:hypothetical protein
MSRYKSSRFIPGARLAFRVFGEVRRRHTMYALAFWKRENAPVCRSHIPVARIRLCA